MRTLRFQLTGFLGLSGAAVALQEAAKRFSKDDALHGLLTGTAYWAFAVGCPLVGAWMLATGVAELRKVRAARSGPPLPKHARPSLGRAVVSVGMGLLLLVGVPVVFWGGK